MLKRLWKSTIALHQRFNVYPPKPVAVRRVVSEEFREFLEAAADIERIKRLPPEQRNVDDLIAPRQHMAEEAADLIVTVCAYLSAHEITLAALKRAGRGVESKNNAKTDANHEVNPKTGKIQRRNNVTTIKGKLNPPRPAEQWVIYPDDES